MNSAFILNHETNLPGQKGEPEGRRRMTVQVMPGPTVGIITLRGWRGWPSRQSFIGCGWKARPFGPLSEQIDIES
jgi:hypothetical protein